LSRSELRTFSGNSSHHNEMSNARLAIKRDQ
jgi:hypothetical protein